MTTTTRMPHYKQAANIGQHVHIDLQRFGNSPKPEALLIACNDPVLDSTLFSQLQSEPMVVWRSPGPVVPPFGVHENDVAGVLDHAVSELGVREIAICGHLPNETIRNAGDENGAEAEDPRGRYVNTLRRIVTDRYGRLEAETLFKAMVEENVFTQTANLRTYPVVLQGLSDGSLKLHNWIYDADRDELYGHSPDQSGFVERMQRRSKPASELRPFLDPCNIYLA